MFNNFFNNKFKINNFTVGNGKSYIIAEAGSNHNGEINKAIKLIDVAKNAGANAVKFQLFRSESFFKTRSKQYKFSKKYEFNRNWIPKLIHHCKRKKIEFLASPFDAKACDLLIKYRVPAIKIASTETFNLNLINYISKKNIPMIVSTGIANYVDILECLEIIKKNKNKDVALLQCSSIYPAKNNQTNLKIIDTYKKLFNFPIGFSDHNLSTLASLAAVAKGAQIIEKHFTLDKNLQGPDHFYAIEPAELKKMINEIRQIEEMQGINDKAPLTEELNTCRKLGIYTKNNLKKNQLIKIKDLRVKIPQKGIESRFLNTINNLKLKKNLEKNKPIKWEDLA